VRGVVGKKLFIKESKREKRTVWDCKALRKCPAQLAKIVVFRGESVFKIIYQTGVSGVNRRLHEEAIFDG